jgi:hypothetical protein
MVNFLATPTTALFRSACFAIGVLPSPFGQLQSPAAQVAVGPNTYSVLRERSQDVLCESNKQAAQVGVPRFRDPQLRVLITGLIPPGDEAKSRTDLPTPAEAIWVFDGEDREAYPWV